MYGNVTMKNPNDASTPKVRKWTHDNIHLWKEKPE